MKKRPLFAAIDSLSRHLLPRSCVLCGVCLCTGYFCNGCLIDLPWVAAACERCGQPLSAPLPEGSYCAGCQQRARSFEKAFAPLLYSFPVDSALKALKFNQQLFYAPAFGELLAPLLEKLFPEGRCVEKASVCCNQQPVEACATAELCALRGIPVYRLLL